jgi:hypothetical protein
VLAEHGTIERQPLLEGRSMYIVMGPLEKRAEKKNESAETIADTIAAKGELPAPMAQVPEVSAETPVEQG